MKQGYNPHNTIPRDITAKKVVFDAGEHYDPQIKSNTHCYSTSQPPLRNLDRLPPFVLQDPNYVNLVGHKIGYFTVIGMLLCPKFDKWVLRCLCGNYEVRTAKTIKKITDKVDQNRCQSCLDLERLRNRDYFQIHGQYPWQNRKNTKYKLERNLTAS